MGCHKPDVHIFSLSVRVLVYQRAVTSVSDAAVCPLVPPFPFEAKIYARLIPAALKNVTKAKFTLRLRATWPAEDEANSDAANSPMERQKLPTHRHHVCCLTSCSLRAAMWRDWIVVDKMVHTRAHADTHTHTHTHTFMCYYALTLSYLRVCACVCVCVCVKVLIYIYIYIYIYIWRNHRIFSNVWVSINTQPSFCRQYF